MIALKQETLARYISSANEGDVRSQLFLGWSYFRGKYVAKNMDQAVKWLNRASEQGSLEAKYRLAIILIYWQSRKEGISMLQEGALVDYPPSLYELGNVYYAGKLTEKSMDQAEMFWTKATNAGHVIAGAKLNRHRFSHSKIILKPYYAIMTIRYVFLFVYFDGSDPRVLGMR